MTRTRRHKLRARYAAAGLSRADADADPYRQFSVWLEQARAAGLAEPDAMAVATVAGNGAPSLRHVLLKGFDARGFVFFTNYGSRKARQLEANYSVAAVFPWLALQRQVIIEGEVDRLSRDDSRAYFHSRPRAAQIGAWASRQSEELKSRAELEQRVASTTAQFGRGEIPLPEFWGGYRIQPRRMEFWQGRDHRLHDRIVYVRRDSVWDISRLYP